MTRLFSYTIPIDDGAAPNPFDELCTLVICKPAIRRVAHVRDWVAGLGSKDAPSGDLSGRLVYAMRVDEVVSMAEYDEQATTRWPRRIPEITRKDLAHRLGDCIYDFSTGSVTQRPGVHNANNQAKDLGGKNALISRHFYYFGAKAMPLPARLLGIIHQTEGHRSNANAEFLEPFVDWLSSLNLEPGQLYGWPDHIVNWEKAAICGCEARRVDGETDDGC